MNCQWQNGQNDSEADILKYRNIEGDSILNALKQNEVLIALEVGGREFSTEKLAETMKGWMLEGHDIALAIGGPDGHSEAVRKQQPGIGPCLNSPCHIR